MFFKMEAMLSYSGTVVLNFLYSARANGFYASGDSIFVVRPILLLYFAAVTETY